MACKQDSECPKLHTCVDGECVSIRKDSGKSPISFKQAASRYLRDKEYERQKVDAYSKFLQDEVEDAIEARQDEAESTDFWGKIGALVVGGVGCAVGFATAGPAGAAAGCVKGAVIGAGLGSAGTRLAVDANTFAENTGVSDDELAMLSADDLKFLKSEFYQVQDWAEDQKADLKDYDKNEWKTHVMNVLGDMWTSYSVASAGTNLASLFAPKPTDVSGAILSETPETMGASFGIDNPPDFTSGIGESISNILESNPE